MKSSFRLAYLAVCVLEPFWVDGDAPARTGRDGDEAIADLKLGIINVVCPFGGLDREFDVRAGIRYDGKHVQGKNGNHRQVC